MFQLFGHVFWFLLPQAVNPSLPAKRALKSYRERETKKGRKEKRDFTKRFWSVVYHVHKQNWLDPSRETEKLSFSCITWKERRTGKEWSKIVSATFHQQGRQRCVCEMWKYQVKRNSYYQLHLLTKTVLVFWYISLYLLLIFIYIWWVLYLLYSWFLQ